MNKQNIVEVMNKKVTYAALLGMCLTAASCSSNRKVQGCDYPDLKDGAAITTSEIQVSRVDDEMDAQYLTLSDAQRQLVKRNNQFALNLFQKVEGFDSKVVSPMSVTSLMAMLANGACGQTRQEILATIGADSISLSEMNDFYKALMEYSGKADKSTTVNMANYIALNQQYQLKAPFAKTMADKYAAGVEPLDFTTQKTTQHINQWCKQHTDGMIPKIIDQVDASAVSYVMNAIFFNGSWKDKFNKSETKEERFQGYTRDVKRVKMMHRNDKMDYYDNDSFSAVNLPYGNGTYRMTVLLPHANASISQMMKSLNVESLEKIQRGMDECYVDLKLPRFTTELELPLNDIISQLGAPSMFTGKADFSCFADGNLYISKMLQKAKIEVSEEGTKAAAVTAAIMTMAMLEPNEPRHVEFHANRPFVYLITEASSGSILFMGQFTGE